MHRVHFTSHDIRNARVGASYGPLAETAFSFDHLYRRAQGLRFDGWRSRVRPALGATARDLAGLLPRSLDLVMVTGPATCLDEGLAAFASASPAVIDLELGATAAAGVVAPRWAPRLAERDPGGRAVVAGALAEYYRRAIDPFWPRVSALLERERARAAGLLGERGLDHLLASLLGATRAVVLDAIAAGPCTTSELARATGSR